MSDKKIVSKKILGEVTEVELNPKSALEIMEKVRRDEEMQKARERVDPRKNPPWGFQKGNEMWRKRTDHQGYKKMMLASRKYMVETTAKYFQMPVDTITAIADQDSTPSMDKAIIQHIIKSTKGDTRAFDFLLNRLIGKVKELIEVQHQAKPMIVTKQDGAQVIMTNDEELDATEATHEEESS